VYENANHGYWCQQQFLSENKLSVCILIYIQQDATLHSFILSGNCSTCFGLSVHTHTSSNSSTIAAGSSNGVTNTRCCRYSCMRSWWWVVVPPETRRAVSRQNKLCNVASCWTYIRIKKKIEIQTLWRLTFVIVQPHLVRISLCLTCYREKRGILLCYVMQYATVLRPRRLNGLWFRLPDSRGRDKNCR